MIGKFATHRVVWEDGREGVFEVYFDNDGNPIELGPEIRCDATHKMVRSPKVAAALDEAARNPPLFRPETWPGFPGTPEEELVEVKTDPTTGETIYVPLDEDIKRWCLEEEEQERSSSLARRIAWAPGTVETHDGDSSEDQT